MNSIHNHPLEPNTQANPNPSIESPTAPDSVQTKTDGDQKPWKDYLKDKRVIAFGAGLLALGVGLGGLRMMGGKPTPPVAKATSKIEIPDKPSELSPSTEKTNEPQKLPNFDPKEPPLPVEPNNPLKLPEIPTDRLVIRPVKGDDIPTLPPIPATPDNGFKPAPTPQPMGTKGNENEIPLLPGRIKIETTGNDNKSPESPPPLGPAPNGKDDMKEPPLTLPPIPAPPETEPKTPKLPEIPTLPNLEGNKETAPKISDLPPIDPKSSDLPKIPETPSGVKLPDPPKMGDGGIKLPELPSRPDVPTKKDDIPTLPSLPKDSEPIKPDPIKLTPIEPHKTEPIDPIKSKPIDPIKPGSLPIDSGNKPIGGGNDYEEDLHVIEGRETYSDVAQQYLGKRECAAALERYNLDQKGGKDGVIRVPPEWVLRERYPGLFGRREEKSAPVSTGSGQDVKGVSFDPVPKIGDTRIEPPGDPREYVVQSAQGETLKEIAQRVYGDPSLWGKIFDANERLDINPRVPLPRGTRLLLPK